MATARDPKDFGPIPPKAKGFKLPPELPTKRDALLAIVAASGSFPVRAARWLAPREARALLTDDFPFESSAILSVREPRQIKNVDDLLILAADRRTAYYAELKERKQAKAADPAKAEGKP